MINKGIEALMNRAGANTSAHLARGLDTGNRFLEAVKRDGDNLVSKMNEVARVSQMSPAEQARALGEAAKNTDWRALAEKAKTPIDKVFSGQMS